MIAGLSDHLTRSKLNSPWPTSRMTAHTVCAEVAQVDTSYWGNKKQLSNSLCHVTVTVNLSHDHRVMSDSSTEDFLHILKIMLASLCVG